MRFLHCGALVVVMTAACSVGLEHGLDETQANEVVAELERAGVSAEKAPDDGQTHWRVLVARGDMAHAVGVLEAAGLPRPPVKGVGEMFAESGLVPSARAERARLAASLSADLSRTLEAIPGVARARVHIALAEDDAARDDDTHARTTAAVSIQTNGPVAIGDRELRRLVAAAVPGLEVDDVDLVLMAATPVAAPPALVNFGPIRLDVRSRPLAIAVLSTLLALIVLLSALVAWGAVRLGALRSNLRDRTTRD